MLLPSQPNLFTIEIQDGETSSSRSRRAAFARKASSKGCSGRTSSPPQHTARVVMLNTTALVQKHTYEGTFKKKMFVHNEKKLIVAELGTLCAGLSWNAVPQQTARSVHNLNTRPHVHRRTRIICAFFCVPSCLRHVAPLTMKKKTSW